MVARFLQAAGRKNCSRLFPLLACFGLMGGPAAQAQPTARAVTPGQLVIKALADSPVLGQAAQVLRRELSLTPADDLRLLRTETDELGYVHERFQQYY